MTKDLLDQIKDLMQYGDIGTYVQHGIVRYRLSDSGQKKLVQEFIKLKNKIKEFENGSESNNQKSDST